MPDKKHTPGPWYASSNGTVHWVHSLPVGSAVVVTCEDAPTKKGKIVSGVGCKVADLRGEAAANARLIAAAPELLEACRTALSALQGGQERQYWTEELFAMDALRAALAKAEGENND